MKSSLAIALLVNSSPVIWSYCSFGVVLAIGVGVIALRGDWPKARGLDKLILLGPLFYAAPVAAFGTEHFTITQVIASLVPKWIPWHYFWAYLVGACFIAAALSIVARVQAGVSSGLLGVTFLLFVLLMDIPGWAQHPRDRFALTYALRELSFSAGAGAFAASLLHEGRRPGAHSVQVIARYSIAIAVLFFGFEQLLHGDHVPAIPLEMVTPGWLYGHAVWTYLAAVISIIAGILLITGKKTRAAVAWLGLSVLVLVLIVYVPIAVVERSNFEGLNYMADTLMFCGAVLLLAHAMPRPVETVSPQ